MRSLGLRQFHGIYTSLGHCMERFAGLLQLVALDIESLAVIGFLINVTFVKKSEAAYDEARKEKAKAAKASVRFCLCSNELLNIPGPARLGSGTRRNSIVGAGIGRGRLINETENSQQ